MNSINNYFQILPNEITSSILGNLQGKDIAINHLVCSLFHKILNVLPDELRVKKYPSIIEDASEQGIETKTIWAINTMKIFESLVGGGMTQISDRWLQANDGIFLYFIAGKFIIMASMEEKIHTELSYDKTIKKLVEKEGEGDLKKIVRNDLEIFYGDAPCATAVNSKTKRVVSLVSNPRWRQFAKTITGIKACKQDEVTFFSETPDDEITLKREKAKWTFHQYSSSDSAHFHKKRLLHLNF